MTATYDIRINKFATYELQIQIKNGDGESATPADITEHTLRMQIRETAADAEFSYELNLDNERIVIVEASEGKAKLVIPASDTAGFGWTEGVYDLLLIGPEKTTRVLEGKVTIAQGVTR